MAVVKPTQKEWEHVQKKIKEMFRKRLDYAENWAHYGHTEVDLEKIMLDEVYPPDIREKVHAMGDLFFDTAEGLSVVIRGERYTLSFPKMLVPTKLNHYGSTNKLKHPTLLEVADKRKAAIQKVEKERDEFEAKVKALWFQAPSINSLVKVWHPILDLLSPDTIKRINTKIERANLAKSVDTAELATLSTDYLKSKIGK